MFKKLIIILGLLLIISSARDLDWTILVLQTQKHTECWSLFAFTVLLLFPVINLYFAVKLSRFLVVCKLCVCAHKRMTLLHSSTDSSAVPSSKYKQNVMFTHSPTIIIHYSNKCQHALSYSFAKCTPLSSIIKLRHLKNICCNSCCFSQEALWAKKVLPQVTEIYYQYIVWDQMHPIVDGILSCVY